MKKVREKIAYIGLAHLGINYAASASEHNYNIICYDENKNLINKFISKKIPISEPGLSRLLSKNMKKIIFTNNVKEIYNCKIVFISYDISTDNKNKSDLVSFRKTINKVISFINSRALLVILSQVPPGFTRKINWPKSKLFYQAETLVYGKAIERALNPERLIIGCSNPNIKLHRKLNNFFKLYKAPIIKMSYESAELTKISINMYLISSVITTNKIAEICEELGANWSDIIPALQLDNRIGKHAYLKPGLGISGGNLERDLFTITSISNNYNLDDSLFQSWNKISEYKKSWAWKKLKRFALKNDENIQICILGLAYKENTDSTKNSPALKLLKKLKNKKVLIYDPKAKLDKKSNNFMQVNSSIKAIKNSDVLLIMTPWPEFRKITSKKLLDNMRGKIIIDPYYILREQKLSQKGFNYFAIGESFS